MKTNIIALLPAIMASFPSLAIATASGIKSPGLFPMAGFVGAQSPTSTSTIIVTESATSTYTVSLVRYTTTIAEIESEVVVSPGFTGTEISTLMITQVVSSMETITGAGSTVTTSTSTTTASSGAGPTFAVGGLLGVVAVAALL